uniref:Uncharacterized protein n=1 Tax=viral metagenome TaxID=1070528 RepID=A0A6C0ADM8_9ZZZZ
MKEYIKNLPLEILKNNYLEKSSKMSEYLNIFEIEKYYTSIEKLIEITLYFEEIQRRRFCIFDEKYSKEFLIKEKNDLNVYFFYLINFVLDSKKLHFNFNLIINKFITIWINSLITLNIKISFSKDKIYIQDETYLYLTNLCKIQKNYLSILYINEYCTKNVNYIKNISLIFTHILIVHDNFCKKNFNLKKVRFNI